MLDMKLVTDSPDLVRRKLAERRSEVNLEAILALNEERKRFIHLYDDTRVRQRALSEAFKKKGAPQAELDAARAELQGMSARLKEYEVARDEAQAAMEASLLLLPNLHHDSVPVGASAEDNVEVRRSGDPVPLGFDARPHDELGASLGILDMEAGAKISGARFALYRGAGARLERALAAFMLDLHTGEHGYTEVLTPFLVKRDSMVGTGQLPKFEEEAFKTEDDYFLIPTSEVSVTNIHREEILEGERLPIKYAAWSPCFRREAGSYGRDTRGLIRLHQFQKVEMVKLTTPETSYDELESLVGNAEHVLSLLGLTHRTMLLCSGDLGFGAAKCYDVEVWAPGQNRWVEISSCSNCEDFQARRASIRYRPDPAARPRFVHTLNGSGLAVGRTIVAILEAFQQADGSVRIPDVLRPYMGGMEAIRRP